MAARRTIVRYPGAAEFLGAAEAWLLAAEADNNIVLSVARLLLSDDHPFREPVYVAAANEGERIVGCALCAPPDGLDLTDMPAGFAALLVDSVAMLHPRLALVSGPQPPVVEFARAWARERGGEWQVRHRATLMLIERVQPPRPTSGRLRNATAEDWPTLTDWAQRFARELNSTVDMSVVFARLLRRQSIYVWDDGGPKCVVGVSGVTPNGRRISAAYTPEQFRERGYASNAVAAVSRQVLDAGKRCLLFAERETPAPLKIYQNIGYIAMREQIAIELNL